LTLNNIHNIAPEAIHVTLNVAAGVVTEHQFAEWLRAHRIDNS